MVENITIQVAVQAVGCSQCGNEFFIRESAMRPDGSAKTCRCPYCEAWLVVKPTRRRLEAALLPEQDSPEIPKPRLSMQELIAAVETARAYRGNKTKHKVA